MSFVPRGKHLIAGQWIGGANTFQSDCVSGENHSFAVGAEHEVAKACEAASEAFASFAVSSREMRAQFLNAIADEIEKRGGALTTVAMSETGLPAARLDGERGRTTAQLRLFASHILKGNYLDRRRDAALPDRKPLPRTELFMMQRPIGPVGVFGASNFPLAFSTAGGDTASALAAGCPVVMKGHQAHPGTAELVAEAILAALTSCKLHLGVFSLVQGNDRHVGEALVKNPHIKAVGFTGSLQGGRALFNLCAARPEPIPFFGELGSINPLLMLPHALKRRATDLGSAWAQSLTLGAGQFCTNPGVVFVIKSAAVGEFIASAKTALQGIGPQTMLTTSIANAYADGVKRITQTSGVEVVYNHECPSRSAMPALFSVSGSDWLREPQLAEEVFGPLGIVVEVENLLQLLKIAHHFHGQLTATLHMEKDDVPEAQQLLPILEQKVGRILANGFPTGVEVCDSMVHGGPFPASTNFGATSVGTLAIRRFLRPVCYQNFFHELLPADLIQHDF
jgi:2,5-dioxopentanoate dehydrogenase